MLRSSGVPCWESPGVLVKKVGFSRETEGGPPFWEQILVLGSSSNTEVQGVFWG